jgi:predicted alpha/beta-hydrolase family hydrolase
MPAIANFVETGNEPGIRGYLHTPDSPNGSGIVLAHGAGSNAQAPLLISLAETFCAAGFTVLRCDLPYRQVRSFGPPGPGDAARDRAGLKNAVAALANELGAPRLAAFARRGNSGPSDPSQSPGAGKIFLGGHSYGGRQASMLCAEEPGLVPALLLLSYPLHPPRKPEQQRTQHLPDLRTPALFVSGTRDPFGSIAELQQALKMIPAKTKLLPIEGAGHDLGFKGKAKQEEVPRKILSELTELLS